MPEEQDLIEALRRLATGDMSAEEWLAWWQANSEQVAAWLNRGQFIRLKPPKPGGFGPPSKCALVSQGEAAEILQKAGVAFDLSDRYQREWEEHFQKFLAERKSQAEKRDRVHKPVIACLARKFPKFAKFLRAHPEIIESCEGHASPEEIAEREAALGVAFPASYREFLGCCRELSLGDTLRFGLLKTFLHQSRPGPPGPSDGNLCFGECWLEADGDQVLFETGSDEPAVLYYAHERQPPQLRRMADSFSDWLADLPTWDAWRDDEP